MMFDHGVFFDSVRASLFGGELSQQQIDGHEAILSIWEMNTSETDDIRWLAYALATTYHETSREMWPIEEYGKGAGQPYGEPDSETGLCYYGRGFIQLTWKDNYEFASETLRLPAEKDLVWHPEQALNLQIATDVLLLGMRDGWFRSSHTFAKYFNASTEDPFNAREIVNGDKKIVPDWSCGVSIGDLIVGYYGSYHTALFDARITEKPPETVARVDISVVGDVEIYINGVKV